jgi:hypothetical protein
MYTVEEATKYQLDCQAFFLTERNKVLQGPDSDLRTKTLGILQDASEALWEKNSARVRAVIRESKKRI